MTFADFLIQKRAENNLTQRDLAELFEVSHQTISNWEKGKNIPAAQLVRVIAKTFGVSEAYLLALCEQCDEKEAAAELARAAEKARAEEQQRAAEEQQRAQARSGTDRAAGFLKKFITIFSLCLGLLVCGVFLAVQIVTLCTHNEKLVGAIVVNVWNTYEISVLLTILGTIVLAALIAALCVQIVKAVRKNQKHKKS